RGPVEAILFEKDCNAGNVEGFSDFCRDSLEQGAFLDDGAYLIAEGFKDLLGIVGIAEEAAVGPFSQAIGAFAEPENRQNQERDGGHFTGETEIVAAGGRCSQDEHSSPPK